MKMRSSYRKTFVMGLFILMLLSGFALQDANLASGQEGVKVGFRVSPLSAFAPAIATFDIDVGPASSTRCEEESYELDFGDGSLDVSGTAAGPTRVSHTYINPGTYNAVLIFTRYENVGIGAPDCRPESGSASATITVQEPEPIRFVGSDGNWFNPENWVGGRVPGPNDDVQIDEDAFVVIDPAQDPNSEAGILILRDLHLAGNARLETRSGIELSVTRLIMDEFATFFLRSSVLNATHATLRSQINPPTLLSHQGKKAALPWGCSWCGLSGNPSFINIDNLEVEQMGLLFYIGGTQPATSDGVGDGFYANIRAKTVSLVDSTLAQELIYEFEPEVGDRFIIVEATESLTGQFENYSEGSIVAQNGDVDIVVHYTSSQIILIAEQTEN